VALSAPPGNLASLRLDTVPLDPSRWVRVTRFPGTESYFGKGASCRLDDPLQSYGVCYAGGVVTLHTKFSRRDERTAESPVIFGA